MFVSEHLWAFHAAQCWCCHQSQSRIQLLFVPATKCSYKWALQMQRLALERCLCCCYVAEAKAMTCVRRGREMSKEKMTGHNFKATDLINDSKILKKKKKKSSLYWPLKTQPPSSWRRWRTTFLSVSPLPRKWARSAVLEVLNLVLISQQTYTLFKQVGGSWHLALTLMLYLNRHSPQIGAQEQEPH